MCRALGQGGCPGETLAEGEDQGFSALHMSVCVHIMRPEVSLGVLPKVPPTLICFYYTFMYLFNLYVHVFCLHVCAPYVCSTLKDQRRALCPLELEL